MIDYREDNKWTVYIHISPSNKYYVGITSQKPKDRWHGGSGYKKNDHFYRVIKKYGWDNFQHVIIAEKHLGRKITPNEVVHHIDGDKLNNCITNLEVMSRSEHARLHALENLKNRRRNNLGQFK